MFLIKTIPKCPTKILQAYQSGDDLGLNFTGNITVVTKDKNFTSSLYPFMQSDHYVNQILGKLPISIGSFLTYDRVNSD